ncbi:phenylalanine--tRNA ligase subunit alpha [Candidatus Micrarchaeota archaeon]|nr:phenylalanine--tRNA ligase subunit alpha [Candidatus Micrarchaeota archaeon]
MILDANEKRVLLQLRNGGKDSAELSAAAGMDMASVERSLSRLADKKLVTITEETTPEVRLGGEGRRYLREGLPERKALALLSSRKLGIGEVEKRMGKQQAQIALSWLTRLGVLDIRSGMVELSEAANKYIKEELPQERVLQLLGEGRQVPQELRPALEQLLKRGSVAERRETKKRRAELTDAGKREVARGITVEEEVSGLTPELIASRKWRGVKLREYDVEAPVERSWPARRHFLMQAADYCRDVWVSLGFTEMTGPLIDSAFWNMDALFIPQDHPAREMQDTLYIKGEASLPERRVVEAVRKAHEKGVDGSRGWGYKWSEQESRRVMLRPHTTSLSARMLYQLGKTHWKREQGARKYFAIGRAFRNEVVDWKHGFEFNQTEGIVVGEGVTFRNHVHLMKEFYRRMGFGQARFRPAYYPYTEMSLGIEVFHPVHKKWVELGGSGIFRPEVVEPLLGEPVPVLAWGPGFDRMVMSYYNINNFGDLYKSDLAQVRNAKEWLMVD